MRPLNFLGGFAQRFPVTVGIFLSTLIFFGVEVFLGGGSDLPTLIRMGALRADRVAEHHELARLVLPIFLHMGPVHLVLNMAAFLQLGMLVEHLWGGARLFGFYILCGVVGALFSAVFSSLVSVATVGASGAIMGLAGVVLGARFWGPEGLQLWLEEVLGRRLLWGVLATFFLGLMLAAVLPIVDNWGHLGGFLCGLGISLTSPSVAGDQGQGRPLAGGAMLVVAASMVWAVLGGGAALSTFDEDTANILRVRVSQVPDSLQAVGVLPELLTYYQAAGESARGLEVFRREVDRLKEPLLLSLLASTLMDADPPQPEATSLVLERWVVVQPESTSALNALAWHLVTRPDAVARDPMRAEPLSRRALEHVEEPESDEGKQLRAACLDTLGEVLYQLGELEEALEVQREAVSLADDLPDRADVLARLEKIEEAAQ